MELRRRNQPKKEQPLLVGVLGELGCVGQLSWFFAVVVLIAQRYRDSHTDLSVAELLMNDRLLSICMPSK